ncbi:hypothetical protein JW905_08960 [bacterium]|nr:hypothetical protein [candidate division CSSED10-310 bacterium]
MPEAIKSKREHCPKCGAVIMHNYVLVQPGEEVEVFVECITCGAFVARYTLKDYTGEDPYRSFQRQARKQHQAVDAGNKDDKQKYINKVWENYKKAKSITAVHEDHHDLEDILLEQID